MHHPVLRSLISLMGSNLWTAVTLLLLSRRSGISQHRDAHDQYNCDFRVSVEVYYVCD